MRKLRRGAILNLLSLGLVNCIDRFRRVAREGMARIVLMYRRVLQCSVVVPNLVFFVGVAIYGWFVFCYSRSCNAFAFAMFLFVCIHDSIVIM